MPKADINLILISGAVGVGKTSVAEELSGQLEQAEIAHTFVDLDGLAKTYPRPDNDPFGELIALTNLSAIWSNASQAGARNLIIARVIETEAGARRIEHAVGAKRSLIVELSARDDTLLARVRTRETGSGREWHEQRALELSASLARSALSDIRIDTTDLSVTQIAQNLLSQIDWL